jgi:hypothetical protein
VAFGLRELLPERSLYFLPREEALRRLREATGEDFEYHDARWEEWGRKHRLFFPGT